MRRFHGRGTRIQRRKVLDGKVRKRGSRTGRTLGIPVLDGLFVLDGDPAGATTSRGMEMRVVKVRKGRSRGGRQGCTGGAALRMLRWEKSQMLGVPWPPNSFLRSPFLLNQFLLCVDFFFRMFCIWLFICIWGPRGPDSC